MSFLLLPSEILKSSEEVLTSNIFLFLLCISIGLFFYSVHHSDDDIIELGKPSYFESRKGTIRIGRVVEKEQKKRNFFLSLKDLEKHMFICGATGTGKTNFLQHFLINFTKIYKLPFMLVEFKGEYHFLQKKIENLLIIRPGENFSINIFNPEGTLPVIHAERIFDILKSGKFLDDSAEFSPQMEKVLVEILTKVCENKEFQSWEGFYKYCRDYANNKKNKIPMLSQTLISITNRIRRFSLGSLKAIFDTNSKLKVRDLFKRNVLFDLSSIIRLGGEKEDALFFLNMVLKYLWDQNLTRGSYNFRGIQHLTIVEDTQYFASKGLTRQKKLSSYLEDIALLQRGTGECLISLATQPDISQEILANCGVIICFKTHMERELLSKLLNLDVENEDYLSILEEGQCLVRVNSIKRPFQLKIPLIKREWLKSTEINEKNNSILKRTNKLIHNGVRKKNLTSHKNLKENFRNLSSKLKKKRINIMKKKEYQNEYDEENDDFDLNEEFSKLEEEESEKNDLTKLEKYLNKLYIEQEQKKHEKSYKSQ